MKRHFLSALGALYLLAILGWSWSFAGHGDAGPQGGSGGTPGGSDTHVQFNDSSAFGGDAGLTYDKTNDALTVTGGADAVHVTVKGHSTQTSNILLVEKSDGTDLFAVSNAQTFHSTGSASAPGIAPISDTNTGFYSSGAGIFNLSVGGSRRELCTSSLRGFENGRDLAWYSAGFAGLVAGINHIEGTNILDATDGASGSGWFRSRAGRLVNTADQTVDSTTMANATSLVTVSIATTRKISFVAELHFSAGDTLADGVKVDFDQGTATATAFIASAQLFDGAAFGTLTTYRSTALATDFEATTTATTDFFMIIRGHLVVNSPGTWGLRFAKEADAGTALTLRRGSAIFLEDMP